MSEKPVHVKPSFYANCFFMLKGIAYKYGYNLVIHGSMQRDMDLVALPWTRKAGDPEPMIKAFAKALKGKIQMETKKKIRVSKFGHGRVAYVIDLARHDKDYYDRQYYLDISVFKPQIEKEK